MLTSGASEAIAIGLKAAPVAERLVSVVEHDALLRLCRDSMPLPVNQSGVVDLAGLRKALSLQDSTALVAIQHVNSETGVVQPVDEIATVCREANAIWICDCSQSACKLELPEADLIIVSGHKLGGPPGVGALLVRDLSLLPATGGQERGYRGGTENLPGVLGFLAAVKESRAWLERARDLRLQLDRMVAAAGGLVVASDAQRLPTISSYRMPGVAAAAQLIQFDMAGISVSAGSACSSGTLKSSPVLAAMGLTEEAAGEVIRVSFGPTTSRAQIYRFVEVWTEIFARATAS